jgi:hypothetical protein
MTDPNRGAYTPQSDAPLSFDARRAGGARGPMPITLIFSALILLVLVVGGGVAVLYHNGARKAGEPPQPVGQAVGTMRAAPEVQSPPQVAIAPAAPPSGAAPTFTPPPEQPAARPIEVAPLPPPPAKTEPLPPVAPAQQAKAEPAPKALAIVGLSKTAPPAPKAAAAPVKTAAAPAPKAASGALVQIGAYSSSALASNGWNEVAKLMPGEMAGKTKEVEPVERDGKTLYRARIGGFASHADAERLCLALLSKGRDCKVV